MNTPAITRVELWRYGVLAVGIAFAGFPLYVLAPDFYATQHGVSLAALGLVLLGLRAFDALQDPIIGRLSDRYSSRIFGIMAISALLLVASIYALFHPSSTHSLLWFTLSMALAVTAYSILSINLNALGALWTRDTHAQTRIASTREAFGLVGLLLAVSLPSLLGKVVPASDIFFWFSAILGVLVVFALLCFGRWFSHHRPTRDGAAARTTHIWHTLRTLPHRTQRLFCVYGLSVLASSIPAVLVLFFIRDRLDAESYSGVFLLLYFLSGALTMPVWKRVSVRLGKHQSWLASMLLAVASFVWAFFLGTGDTWQFGIICIASGMALGADLVLPPSILADDIHAHQSEAHAAIQFSLLALLSKAGLAIGSAITLPLLEAAGFVPAAPNTAAALTALSVAYALIPCVIKLGACALLYRFFITPHRKNTHETSFKTHSHRNHHHA